MYYAGILINDLGSFIMNKSYKIYVIIMFVLLAVPGLLLLVLPEREYSSNENRYLDKMPKADLQEISTGGFQDKVTSAASDQFIVRDFMMGVSTTFKKTLGFKDIGGVYIAKDNRYISKITSSDIVSDTFIKNLMYTSYFAEQQEAEVYTMLVPSPGTILGDKLPAFAPFYNADSMYNTVNTLLDTSKIIDIREILEQQESAADIYYKTDHHWTLQGAYAAYREYCNTTGIQKHSYGSFNPEKVSGSFYGTLYSKVLDFMAKPDEIYAIRTEQAESAVVTCDGEEKKGIYDRSALSQKDKYAYFFGGNYGRMDIKTGSSTGLKLLVIKDSFANSFVPFLLGDYSSITMIDPRYYNKPVLKVAKQGKYDHILILYETSNFAGDSNLYKLTR